MRRTCPICKRAIPKNAKPDTLPFCSSRCKMVDLGNWLQGTYRVPAETEALFSEGPTEVHVASELEEAEED